MHTDHVAGRAIRLGSAGILKPGPWRRLRTMGWVIALFSLVLLCAVPAMTLAHHLLPVVTPVGAFLANGVGGLIAVAVYAVLVRFGEARRPDELAFGSAPAQLAAGLALGAAMFAAVMTILIACHLYRVDWLGSASAWRAGGQAIEAALIEETLARGVLFRLLWRAFGPTAAFLASAALFGASHLFNPGATVVSALCVALEAGVMLAAFYALTGRLWVSIGVHAAWNFTQGYVFGAAVSGGDAGPALAHSVARADGGILLTGGGFGPEASLPALLVCTAVGLGVVWRARMLGRLATATVAPPLPVGLPD